MRLFPGGELDSRVVLYQSEHSPPGKGCEGDYSVIATIHLIAAKGLPLNCQIAHVFLLSVDYFETYHNCMFDL